MLMTALARLNHAVWIPLLAVRVVVGLLFFESGFEKVESAWRGSLPAFSAALAAFTELVGGGLVAVGLATRPASVALAILVTVAIAVDDLLTLERPLYALVFIWLVYTGPGRISLDHLIRTRLDSRQRLP
jgi:putative oxidoreductase